MNNGKLNVLILPGLFPEYEGDPKGIFVPDYIRSVESCCNVHVLHLRVIGKPGLHQDIIAGIPVSRYGITNSRTIARIFKPFFYAWLFYKGIQLAKRIKDIDLIHAHGVAYNGLLATLIAGNGPTATAVTEHTPSYKIERSAILKMFFRRAVRKASVFLTVSKDQQQQYVRMGIKPRKSLVTYNPVDTELFVPGVNGKNRFRNMLFAGRVVHYKGVQRLIRAFTAIATQYSEWTLTICGKGEDLDKCRNMASTSGFAERIIFIPDASRQVIATEMQRASFLVFPSEQETFGLVIAEAMSCGLPVMTGNKAAQPEQVNATNGIMVDPFSDEAVKNGMEYMMQHFNGFDSAAIRQQVIVRFGKVAFGEKLCSIYREVISAQKSYSTHAVIAAP
jgi:glycosyltransferase involved in cell wall biosynthesis